MEVFRGSYPSASARPPHLPRQSDNGFISTAALSQRNGADVLFAALLLRLRSFPQKMKLHLLGICTWRGEGTLCSVSVLAHAWLGKGRLCVTFNDVKVLSERGCYQETRVESPVDRSLLFQQRWKMRKKTTVADNRSWVKFIRLYVVTN